MVERNQSRRAGTRNSSESKTTARFQDRLRDLSELLMGFVRLHEELIQIIQRKLLAMRKSDLAAIQECVVREGELTRKIIDREGLRKRRGPVPEWTSR